MENKAIWGTIITGLTFTLFGILSMYFAIKKFSSKGPYKASEGIRDAAGLIVSAVVPGAVSGGRAFDLVVSFFMILLGLIIMSLAFL